MAKQENVKGLEVARDFFLNWGLPLLEQEFPHLVGRMAAGRFEGSDVIGGDDWISRDHDWGPQFSLFLSAQDHARHAQALAETMNRHAPAQWNGYRVAGTGDQNVLVESVPHWIAQNTGFGALPTSDREWGIIVRDRRAGGYVEGRESALYFLRHGAHWLDNNAEFARWRTALAEYPEQVWFARLAEECFRLWQYGEYNFVERIARRGDPLAVALSLGKFVEGVMRMLLLLEREYTPYWKWLAYAFRRCARADHYVPLVESLLAAPDRAQQAELVTRICHDVHQELLALGVISGQGVHATIHLFNADNELRAKATWMPAVA